MAPQTTDTGQTHWESVYNTKKRDEVSWYEATPTVSLDLIRALALPGTASILDVGGGVSTLASHLLASGFADVTVADVSARALGLAAAQLSGIGGSVKLVRADVRDHDFGRRYDLWHDRAVLHFMVHTGERAAYRRVLTQSVKPGGHVILAAFASDGPTSCSGLPVRRYDANELAAFLAPDFGIVASLRHEHRTPSGTAQMFTYVVARAEAQPTDLRARRVRRAAASAARPRSGGPRP